MAGVLTRMMGRTAAGSPGSGPIVGTLGVTTGTASYDASANELNLIPITVPSGGVYVPKLVQGFISSTGMSVRGVIYTETSAVPDVLVAATPNLVLSVTGSPFQQDIPFTSPVFLAAGNYWIGIHQSGGDNLQCIGSGSPSRYESGEPFGTPSPNPIGVTLTFGSYIRCSAPYSLT